MTSIPYAGHPTERTRPSRSRRYNLSLLFSLSTTISVVAILVSLSLCWALRSRKQGIGVARRRLSEGGQGLDDEVSVLEGCLDLEADLGIMEARAASSSGGNSLVHLLGLSRMLSQATTGTEAYGAVEGALQVREQLTEGQTGFESIGGQMVHQNVYPVQQSVELGGSDDVSTALNPDSWLDTIPSINLSSEGYGRATDDESKAEQSSVPSAQSRGPEQWTAVSTALDPDSWLDTIPSISPSSEEPGESSDDESEAEETSAPSAAKRQRLDSPVDLRSVLQYGGLTNHPYVRLPQLEDGVVLRNIDVSALSSGRWSAKLSYHCYLSTLRKLFLKEKLSQQDVDLLIDTVERLVAITWLQSQKGPRGKAPIQAVETLGCYLMIFDAIICTAKLIGEHMQLAEWWVKFTESFKTDFALPTHTINPLTKFHVRLAHRIVSALNTYKKGERPPVGEVVALKKLLFCSPLGNHRLKAPRWGPWQQDGECS